MRVSEKYYLRAQILDDIAKHRALIADMGDERSGDIHPERRAVLHEATAEASACIGQLNWILELLDEMNTEAP